jgi:hypothetical protein
MKTYDIAKHGYIVNEAALSDLARRYADGIAATEGVRTTYLQILVAHSKQEVSGKRSTARQEQEAVENTHGKLYGIILDAITTKDLVADDALPKDEQKRRSRERNRRTVFARTSKSTLKRWLEAGGKLSSLDPATVTKEALRVQATPDTKPDEVIARAEQIMERALRVLVIQDQEAAQEVVNDIQARLQEIVTPPKPLTRTRRQVGSMTLTPHL